MCKFCLVASWLGGKKTTDVTKIITPENSAQSSCLNLQLVMWLVVWPKKAHCPPYFADFFDRSAATACKNLLRLTKNDHFFVSEATTLTSCLNFKLKSYPLILSLVGLFSGQPTEKAAIQPNPRPRPKKILCPKAIPPLQKAHNQGPQRKRQTR